MISFSTERLLLRRPTLDDAQAIFDRYAGSELVTRYVGWPRHQTISDTYDFLTFSDHEWERWGIGPLLAFSRHDHQLLGSTGLSLENANHAATGYVFAEDSWGRGFATESLVAMVGAARERDLKHLAALCHPDHRASSNVLEKCGFQLSPLRQEVAFPNLDGGIDVKASRYELAL